MFRHRHVCMCATTLTLYTILEGRLFGPSHSTQFWECFAAVTLTLYTILGGG